MVSELKNMLRQGKWMGDGGGPERWGLTVPQSFELIDVLERSGIPILGGDLYNEVDGFFDATSMNWYSDQNINDEENDFVKRSASDSRKYLGSLRFDTKHIYVDIVFRDKEGRFAAR